MATLAVCLVVWGLTVSLLCSISVSRNRAARASAPVSPPVAPAEPIGWASGRVTIAADGTRLYVEGVGMVALVDPELRKRALHVVALLVATAKALPPAGSPDPAGQHDALAALWENLGEPGMADTERRLAAALRAQEGP